MTNTRRVIVMGMTDDEGRDDSPECGCDNTLASHPTEYAPSERADGGR